MAFNFVSLVKVVINKSMAIPYMMVEVFNRYPGEVSACTAFASSFQVASSSL